MTGADLRAWRQNRSMKARQLAAWLGISFEHVSRLEHGRKPIMPATVLALDGIDVARIRMAMRGEPLR